MFSKKKKRGRETEKEGWYQLSKNLERTWLHTHSIKAPLDKCQKHNVQY
jgi:hypothetical protein